MIALRFQPVLRSLSLLRLLPALVLFCAAPARANEMLQERHVADVNDVMALRGREPEAGRQLEEGEKLLAQGKAQHAADLFRKVTERAPENGLAWRRLCQALTDIGPKKAALEACDRAVVARASPMTYRAAVAALMSSTPTPDELGVAVLYATSARRMMPEQPWGYAAECSIADRLGDQQMLKSCIAELERVAPNHYETRHAATLAPTGPAISGTSWLGLAAVLAAVIGTVAHALLGRLRLAPAATAIGVLLLGVAVASPAHAESEPADANAPVLNDQGGLSKWPIDDRDPSKTLPTPEQRDHDPLNFGYHLMDLAEKADQAIKRQDYAQAARYYEAMTKAVPDATVGFRRACEMWEKAGDLDRALTFCSAALGTQGVDLPVYERFARLMLAKPTLTKLQVEDLSEVIKHLRTQPGAEHAALKIQCELGVRTEDVARMQDCANEMARVAPNDGQTLVYQFALAIKTTNLKEADRLLGRAKAVGVKPEGIKKMEETIARERSLKRVFERNARWLVPVTCGTLAAILVLGLALHFQRKRARPNPSSPSTPPGTTAASA